MTRINLKWSGHPASLGDKPPSIGFAVITSICIFCTNSLLLTLPFQSSLTNYLLVGAVNAICFCIFIVLVYRVRQNIRHKYAIPVNNRCFLGCEDICYSTFCTVCAITQMARHTAEYDTYRAHCCSATGLPPHVKLPLPPPSSRSKNMYVPFRTP